MRFITSLNPRNIERGRTCINSWKTITEEIIAVQAIEEIEQLIRLFPEVVFVSTNQLGDTFDSICPKIHTLVEQGPGLIVNSDIEIVCDKQSFLSRFIHNEEILHCGIRWDYQGSYSSKSLNPYGVDAFYITNKLMSLYTETSFTVGQPGWDYYFILEAYLANISILTCKDFIFAHQLHTVNWARWKLTLAQSMLEKRYDMSSTDVTKLVQKLTNRVNARKGRRR